VADKLTPEEALEAWAAACSAHTPGDPLTLPVEEALGLVTAAAVRALRPSPAFPAAAMDGIAVRAADLDGAPARLGAADFDVVDTGDPVPAGRDTVIMHERIELSEGFASVPQAPSRGDNVRAVGEDVAEGELLFAPGHRLEPVDVALAAAAGHAELEVLPAPLVAILPTGDEMRPAGEALAPGELADTNSIMLEAQARSAGCHTKRWPILPDDPARLEAAVRRAASECDLVLVIAGTSAGRHDYAPHVLATCGRIVANGVAMRPGHPAVLAVVGDTPVMGCPGYPVSAAVAFDELAQPMLRRMGGAPPEKRAQITARMAAGVSSRAGARERLRVAVAVVEGELVAVPLRRGASVLSALSRADGLITVPVGRDSLEEGEEVVVEGLGRAEPTRSDLLVAGPLDAAIERLVLAGAARGLRVTHCEMSDDDALALVAARGCHAACVSDGEAPPDPGARVRTVRHGRTRLVAPGVVGDLLASLEEEAAATA
jgi:putative molybdopterin biosynthesis protein